MLGEIGRRIPWDHSILGVDNSPTLMALHPGLTTLAYPVAGAIRAVLNLLDGKPAELSHENYSIIERQTVSSPAT